MGARILGELDKKGVRTARLEQVGRRCRKGVAWRD